jgi:hypothetical protein
MYLSGPVVDMTGWTQFARTKKNEWFSRSAFNCPHTSPPSRQTCSRRWCPQFAFRTKKRLSKHCSSQIYDIVWQQSVQSFKSFITSHLAIHKKAFIFGQYRMIKELSQFVLNIVLNMWTKTFP